MTTFRLIPPLTDAQQIAATLSNAAARQPDMALIRAAVASRHPHLNEAEQDQIAEQVAAEQRRAMVTVGFPEHAVFTTPGPLAAGAAAVATIDLAKFAPSAAPGLAEDAA